MRIGTAYTRAVSPLLLRCELTHQSACAIDLARAEAQHLAYEAALEAAGLNVVRMPPLDAFADGVFVEDTALLLGEHAVITRPGALSRAAETASSAAALAEAFTIHRLGAGTLDGGDILRIGRRLHVGSGGRTSREGMEALAQTVAPLGFEVVPALARGCLHLKTAATFIGPDAGGNPVLLYHAAFIDPAQFDGVEPLPVASEEPGAANALRIGSRLIVSSAGPRTAVMLARRGFEVVVLDVSELHKAEAGLTCMSLISEPGVQGSIGASQPE